MLSEIGSKHFPIWLLGDSNPVNWQAQLASPLDPRHPTRHNILTPILDGIQDRLFREHRTRIETGTLYIRNAVEQASEKPKRSAQTWNQDLQQKVMFLGDELKKYKPIVLMTFGSFSYEFARRALKQHPYPFNHWGAANLGEAFRKRIEAIDLGCVNVLPLLHATIARRYFLQSHEGFCGKGAGANYFEMAAQALADFFVQNHDRPELSKIWIR